MADKNLSGKVVVITGGSSGFGKGAAIKFASQGAKVVVAARREDALNETVEECKANGGQAFAVRTDVGILEQVENLAAQTLQRYGRIDVWINDAGAGALGRFDEVPLEDHVKTIQTDLIGTIHGSYFAIKQFRKQRMGTLINVSSVLGKVPTPYYASYTAAKYGVVGLGASIRQELSINDEKDIHVCTVMPTAMDTHFFEHAANYTGHKSVPIPPVFEPDEVVNTLVSLATDPRDEITVGGAYPGQASS